MGNGIPQPQESMKTQMLVPALLGMGLVFTVNAQSPEPVRFTHVNRDMEAVQRLYSDLYLPAKEHPQGWTEPGNCQPGALTATTLKARLTEINYFRKMAGLKPVTLDPAYNRKAQAAAYLMHKNGTLSHHPPTSWKCYSEEGASGAGASNLGYGGEGIIDYIHDHGSNNTSCGHRMWILKGSALTFGYGGTNSTDAIYVFGKTTTHDSLPQYVAWPPAGFFPHEILSERWTFALPGEYGDFAKATVEVSLNGKPLPLSYTETTGYGDGGLAFEIKDWYTWKPKLLNQKAVVRIKGVTVGLQTRSYMYEVAPFQATESPVYAAEDSPRMELDLEEEEPRLLPFAEQAPYDLAELAQANELPALAIETLRAMAIRDLVYDAAFCTFASRIAVLRMEKNPDPLRLHDWASIKIKQHLAHQTGLSEPQIAAAPAPKFILVEIKQLVTLNGQETYAHIAKELAEKFAAHADLKAFVLKYKRSRQCGMGLAVKRVVRNGQTYAGVYAALVLSPAGLRASS